MVLSKVNDIAAMFRQAASIPTVSSGRLVCGEKNVTVHSSWSLRDLDRKEKTTLLRSHVLELEHGHTISQTGPQEINNELWNKTSPSGKFRAVVRSSKDKKNEDKQYIEIYDQTRKLKTIDILAKEKHGKIIGDDGQFGSLEWSASEGHLLYVAEKKKPKAESFFEVKVAKGNGEDNDDVEKGGEFVYRESWGEQLVERSLTVLCVMDAETGVITVLETDDHLSPGQAMWTPDDAGVVFCAWHHEPFRLGLKHCAQRKSGLYHMDIQRATVECLSEEGRAVRFPRFSPDMSRLVYLDCPIGGAHHQCSRLVMIDWATRDRKVVVDIVRHASSTSFQGIFTATLPRNIWFEDGVHLALSTAWRSVTKVVIINTDTGVVQPLAQEAHQSISLLEVRKNYLLLSASCLSSPPHLVLALLASVDHPEVVQWYYPDGPPEVLSWMSSWEVFQHTPTADRASSINGSLDYESILCLPNSHKQTNDNKHLPPLVVFAHGGPHVAFSIAYDVISNFFCLCGYAVLMVNYRGSWGFGQDGIEALLGNVGDMDVKDVESAMVSIVAKGEVDGHRITAFGGSHGGFLTTHLIGQYPKDFVAACSRNPVTNLTSMWSTTDIPDWLCAEGGIPYSSTLLLDDKIFPELWKRSPMFHIDQVTTPMLLLVGTEDKRVPPTQSMEYYRALKARNVPVRCLTYPSNHSLMEVDIEGDCMVNTVVWFNKHMSCD